MSLHWTAAFSRKRSEGIAASDTRLSVGNKEKEAQGQAKVEFHDIFHESIIEGMTNALGEGAARAVLYHLKLDQYVEKPKVFHWKLQTIFADGAATLEQVIIKELYLKLGLPYTRTEPFELWKQVMAAMQLASAGVRREEYS